MSKINNRTETHGVSVYLSPQYYYLAKVLADKNQEPLSALIKRILIPALEEAASASFRVSNAISYALKNDELSPSVAEEIRDYISRRGSTSEASATEGEEVQ